MNIITDVLIAGTGAAGLFCALNMPEHINITLITKDKAEISDSYLAQGGIAVLRDPEDYDDYFEDTMRAGHYKNDKASVHMMIKKSPEIIGDLIKFGVEFDKVDGKLSYTREGGHSKARILHHKDITGKEITSKLLDCAKERSNIKILEDTAMIDIITDGNICGGVIIREKDGGIKNIYAKATVFATGGIGGLFKHSTNYKPMTGDALAIAMKYGIVLKDIDYIQIHPTAFYSGDAGRMFLISESVRGEGAVLLNPDMERFVDELQPRDIVAAAIKKEMKKYGVPNVFLSLKHLDGDKIKKRFPNIYKHCYDSGYDLTRDLIPVTPAQHYFMGGIKIDLDGRTSMTNLFAVGETSCNGVHGANRLGSNSLLEALVFSKNAAHAIVENISQRGKDLIAIENENVLGSGKTFASEDENKDLIFNEIKKRNSEFYELWCSD